jgi:hypothetical protein
MNHCPSITATGICLETTCQFLSIGVDINIAPIPVKPHGCVSLIKPFIVTWKRHRVTVPAAMRVTIHYPTATIRTRHPRYR